MRVLITNDDGVEAAGIHALTAAVVAAGHDAYVVAPSGERSGSGAAIGRLHRSGPVACTTVEWPELPGIAVHSLDVPPAAAVYAGVLGGFGPPPDVVASGINPGMNYGHLGLHSGTVGAALTAVTLGIPAVAVSIAWAEEPRWATAGAFVPDALEWVVQGPPCALNLNVPDLPLAEVRGVRAAVPHGFAERWDSERRPGELELRFAGRRGDPEPGSDLAAAHDGWVAATVLHGLAVGDAGPAAGAISGRFAPGLDQN